MSVAACRNGDRRAYLVQIGILLEELLGGLLVTQFNLPVRVTVKFEDPLRGSPGFGLEASTQLRPSSCDL